MSSRSLPAARPELLLASRSPQRRAILAQLGVSFAVHPVDVEEVRAGAPRAVARANAAAKALAAAGAADAAQPVLGVDTIVASDGEIFGKPPDAAGARATLRRLAGRTHAVVGGFAVVVDGQVRAVGEDATDVTFRALDQAAIERYVAAGEWRGRAGGYAIQGRGAALVRAVAGDYLNVVGLPVAALMDAWPGLLDGGQ